MSPGYLAQFGIHDNPKWTNYWLKRRMPDELFLDDPNFEPHDENNLNYTMGFAREHDSSSGMQVFINLRDNSELFAGKDILTFARIVNVERERLSGLFPAEVSRTSRIRFVRRHTRHDTPLHCEALFGRGIPCDSEFLRIAFDTG